MVAEKATKTVKVYTRITDPSKLFVGKRYFVKMSDKGKYTEQSIRDRIRVDHKKGLHVGETIEEYEDYRKQMGIWCRRGWLYDLSIEVIGDEKNKEEVMSKPTTIVSLRPDNDIIQTLFETDESRDALGFKTFSL